MKKDTNRPSKNTVMMENEKDKEGVTRLKGDTAFHNSNS